MAGSLEAPGPGLWTCQGGWRAGGGAGTTTAALSPWTTPREGHWGLQSLSGLPGLAQVTRVSVLHRRALPKGGGCFRPSWLHDASLSSKPLCSDSVNPGLPVQISR